MNKDLLQYENIETEILTAFIKKLKSPRKMNIGYNNNIILSV